MRYLMAMKLEDPDGTSVEADDYTPESYNEYLLAEILLPHDGDHVTARVQNRVKDKNGKPIGLCNANPLLDMRECKVEFPGGTVKALQANLIAENMFSQIDSKGRSYAILKEIVDHRTSGHALSKDDGFFIGKGGRQYPKMTTRGWEINVEWKDGPSSWLSMKDLKILILLSSRNMQRLIRLPLNRLLPGGYRRFYINEIA
jgi:hypothetical protein